VQEFLHFVCPSQGQTSSGKDDFKDSTVTEIPVKRDFDSLDQDDKKLDRYVTRQDSPFPTNSSDKQTTISSPTTNQCQQGPVVNYRNHDQTQERHDSATAPAMTMAKNPEMQHPRTHQQGRDDKQNIQQRIDSAKTMQRTAGFGTAKEKHVG
jgi:hypothetical protein